MLKPIRRAKQMLEREIRRLRGTELRIHPEVRLPRVRLGDGDGEWTFAASDPRLIYSVGVGKDLRFERDLLKRNPKAKIVAFDPTPVSIRWIAGQTMPEGFRFLEWGLADYDGTAKFSLPQGHSVSFVMGKGEAEGQVKKLSTIMRELGHTHVDILKMDIEGAEYGVIKDLAATRPNIDQILVEFHHRMPGHTLQQTREAVTLLQKAGYALFHISPRGLEYSFIRIRR